MISKEQLRNGIVAYIDGEVIPHLPALGKWGLGSMVVLATRKFDNIYDELSSNKIVNSLGITKDGMIDANTLLTVLKESADKYGKVEVSVPIIGTMVFTPSDVDNLRNYIGVSYE